MLGPACLQVRMAVFSQHHVDGLDMSKSPLLYLCHSFPVSTFKAPQKLLCLCHSFP